MLTIIDEYSRFPFAFPSEDASAQTVIKCLSTLFSVFGIPTFIHTDRCSGFMSSELKNFLLQKGISSSRTTSYNPAGNGQIECLNGTLWKAIVLALKLLARSTIRCTPLHKDFALYSDERDSA